MSSVEMIPTGRSVPRPRTIKWCVSCSRINCAARVSVLVRADEDRRRRGDTSGRSLAEQAVADHAHEVEVGDHAPPLLLGCRHDATPWMRCAASSRATVNSVASGLQVTTPRCIVSATRIDVEWSRTMRALHVVPGHPRAPLAAWRDHRVVTRPRHRGVARSGRGETTEPASASCKCIAVGCRRPTRSRTPSQFPLKRRAGSRGAGPLLLASRLRFRDRRPIRRDGVVNVSLPQALVEAELKSFPLKSTTQ